MANPITDAVSDALAGLRDVAVELVRRYHRLDLTLPDLRLDQPVLFVANHGFGGIFDLNNAATLAALAGLDSDRPVTILTHQLAWTLGVGPLLEPLGVVPASRASADEAFALGHHVLVLPGGDLDAGKPFTRRNDIVFGGRRGFAHLAVDHRVPIVPVVTAGAGESLLVLSDCAALARALRLDRLLRIKALPVSVSLPWGLSVGAVGLLPYLPLPTKLRTTVLAPMTAEPAESADAFGSRVESAMQTALTAKRRLLLG